MNDPGLLSGIIMLTIFALLGARIVTATSRSRPAAALEVQLFLAAIVIRFALSVGLYSFGLVEIIKDEDASGWMNGVSYYKAWKAQGYAIIDLPYLLLEGFQNSYGVIGSYAGYNYLLGALFLATEIPTRLCAATMSNFLGAMSVVLTYRIGSVLFSQWVSVRTAWIVCFLPSMVMWGAQTIKEPVVLFLEAAILYGCLRLREMRFRPWLILWTVLALLALVPFRFYVVYIIGGAFTLSLLGSFARSRRSNLGATLAILACVISVLLTSGVLARHLSIFGAYDLDRIDYIRQYEFKTTGSGVDWSHDTSTPYGKVMTIAAGAVYFFLAPFPWQVASGSFRMLITAPEVFAWWVVLFFGVSTGIRLSLKSRFDQVQVLLFFTAGVALLYSVSFYNVGLAYRQRSQIIPWLLMFALVGFERRISLRRAAAGWAGPRSASAPARRDLRTVSQPEDSGREAARIGGQGVSGIS